MKLRCFGLIICFAICSIVCSGCGSKLNINDFLTQYNSMGQVYSITKTIEYTIDEHNLFNKQIFQRDYKDDSLIVRYTETNKSLNQITLDDTRLYNTTTKDMYYYNNQVGEVVNNQIIWRAGLLEEITGLWGGGKRDLTASYFEKIVVDNENYTLTADVKMDYYDRVLSDTVEQLKVTFDMDEQKRLNTVIFSYYVGQRAFLQTLEFGYEEVEIVI